MVKKIVNSWLIFLYIYTMILDNIIDFILGNKIEVTTVILSTIYLFLLVKENIWCWLFGILSSLLSIYLMVEVKLYSEAILFGFYVLVGFYGWYTWSNTKSGKPLAIKVLGVKFHILWIFLGVIVAYLSLIHI